MFKIPFRSSKGAFNRRSVLTQEEEARIGERAKSIVDKLMLEAFEARAPSMKLANEISDREAEVLLEQINRTGREDIKSLEAR